MKCLKDNSQLKTFIVDYKHLTTDFELDVDSTLQQRSEK